MECIIEKDITQDTIDQIVSIVEEYTKDYFTSNFPDDIRIDMKFQRTMYLKDNSEIISCIVFTCLDGSPHITLMATKRSYNNKGYGKLLMQYFVEYVTGIGLNSIELLTFSPDTVSAYNSTVEFYKRVGFKIIREYKDLWEAGTKTLKMRKAW